MDKDLINKNITLQDIRTDIIGELEAINQYENHLDITENLLAKETIADIISEEKIHVGQLFGLLFNLDPTSKTQFEIGYQEFIESTK
ncbi:MAG: hypothetical protein MJ054_02300 [Clostridia bacterium]|nr:hypothetical protein [Clostridia bacterium]